VGVADRRSRKQFQDAGLCVVLRAGCLAAVLACALASVAVAATASSKVRNWPNSPVRHTLRQKVGAATPSFAENLRGDVAVTGNTLETCPQNVAALHKHKHGRAAEPCLNANNNDQNMVYVNVDPSAGHFDSSTATLTVPAGAQVVRAFLYWGADLSRGVNRPTNTASDDAPGGASPQTNPLYTTALLRAGGGPYATINATAQGRDGRWDYIQSWYQQPGTSTGWAYQVRADVTAEINAGLATRARRTGAGNETLPLTVANVQAGKGYNRYAGWNLIVVWAAPTASWRDVTLFDGFDFVQVQGGQQLVVGPLNFTGFQTPHSGKVDADVTVWATEGDRAITGDYLALGGLSPTCNGLTHQSDAAHPIDNFFNSTISSAGATVGGRTPGFNNQLGFDLTTLFVPEGTIPNDATGASLCLGTVGDTYFFGGIAFSSLIRAPNLAITKNADHVNAGPGDVVTYSTEVTNPSTRDPSDPLSGTPVDAATNVVVADELPSGLDFVGFTANPNGACSYAIATRSISCAVGTIAPDASFSYAYQARVEATAQGNAPASLVNNACYGANSEDQPNVLYEGCDPATVVVPPGPPPPADLGVVKTVSHATVAPGARLTWQIVGTNYGPATSTGFVLADQLPPGVDFVSATASSALTCTTPAVGTSGPVICTAPSVPAVPASGSSQTLTVVATVPATTAGGTVLANVATVTGDQTEPVPDPHPNRDQALTRVLIPDEAIPPPEPPPVLPDPTGPPQPPVGSAPEPNIPVGPAGTRLALHKAGSHATVTAGDTIAYTLRVSNIGEASALRVRVCDATPAGLVLTSAPGFSRAGRSVCTTIASIHDGVTKTLHLSFRVTSTRPGRLTNRASVQGSNIPTGRSQASTRVLAPPAPPPPGLG
jgi:large repetitive protein